MKITIERDKSIEKPCSLCHGVTLEKLLDIDKAPGYLGCTTNAKEDDRFVSLKVLVCQECGLIQTDIEDQSTSMYDSLHSEALGKVWLSHHDSLGSFIRSNMCYTNNSISVIEIGSSVNPIARKFSKDEDRVCYIDVLPKASFTLQDNEKYLSGFFPAVKPSHQADIIICSHVFEHIPDDIQAMKEVYRVLKLTGWAILQVPIWAEKTVEDTSIPKEKYADFYGHKDHVRRYGLDYIERLRSIGFNATLDSFASTLPDDFIKRYGLFKSEELYLCKKT